MCNELKCAIQSTVDLININITTTRVYGSAIERRLTVDSDATVDYQSERRFSPGT